VELLRFWLKKINRLFDRQNLKLKKFGKQYYFDKKLIAGLSKNNKLSLRHFKYLPKFLTDGEKKQLSFLFIVILICLTVLGINAFFSFTEVIARSGGRYIEGLVGSPRFINPILSQTNSVDGDLSRLIFSSLLTYDKDHRLTTDLAERYEISEDQLTYTFYLRQDVKWHDGENFDADDIIFTVSSIQDPEFKSPLRRRFTGVVCEKVDDYTVKFTLKESFSPFLSMLTFGILPEHLWYSILPANADLNELNKKPIGSGAWKIVNLKKDRQGIIKSYTLGVNKDYYGDKPLLSELVFKFYPDDLSAIDALKSRSVYGIAYLAKELKAELKKHKNINYHELGQPQYTAVFFNQKNNALLQADYIREVLALATDKKRIIAEVFDGEAKSLDAPILPSIENNPDIVKHVYDLEKAVALLESNGWVLEAKTNDEGITEQFRVKKNQELKITLTTADQSQYIAVANLLKETWEQIGFKTTIEIVDRNKILQDNIATRKYEALLFAQNMATDPDPFAFWHSSQNEYPGANLAIFSDKRVDELLESGRRVNDSEERSKFYWEFQKIVSTKLPVIFLYSPTYTYPQDNRVRGFEVSFISSYSLRFTNLSEWYVRTKRVLK
jgi:peptide/nickel transport system substrate-binding protein